MIVVYNERVLTGIVTDEYGNTSKNVLGNRLHMYVTIIISSTAVLFCSGSFDTIGATINATRD